MQARGAGRRGARGPLAAGMRRRAQPPSGGDDPTVASARSLS